MLTTNYSRNKANQSMKSYTDNQKIATLTPLYEGIRTDLIKAFDEIVITDKRRESYILDVEFGLFIYEYFKENGFLKPVQVEALKNYPNLSNVTQFSVISIMNDALPKKSKESKLSFSAKKLDKYFPPQYSTKERENIIIQLLEQWSADQVQSE